MIVPVLSILAGIFLISLAINIERLKVPNHIKQSIPKKVWKILINLYAIFISLCFAFSVFFLISVGFLNGTALVVVAWLRDYLKKKD
jgi:cyanate permease